MILVITVLCLILVMSVHIVLSADDLCSDLPCILTISSIIPIANVLAQQDGEESDEAEEDVEEADDRRLRTEGEPNDNRFVEDEQPDENDMKNQTIQIRIQILVMGVMVMEDPAPEVEVAPVTPVTLAVVSVKKFLIILSTVKIVSTVRMMMATD